MFYLDDFCQSSNNFVIPRNEESPQVIPQTKLPIFVESLTEIPRSSE